MAEITKLKQGTTTYDLKDAGAKRKQTAVSSPSASGNAAAFIDTISQNEEGVITATKKNVQIATSAITSGTLGVARGGTGAGSFTTGRVIVSDGSSSTGALKASDITTTELGYLDGVTSNIQDQINAISGGGTDHIRFVKTGIVSGQSMTPTADVAGGYTISVGDLIIGNNGGFAKVTAVNTGANPNWQFTYLGMISTTMSYSTTTTTTSNDTLVLPTTGAISVAIS